MLELAPKSHFPDEFLKSVFVRLIMYVSLPTYLAHRFAVIAKHSQPLHCDFLMRIGHELPKVDLLIED